MFGYPDETLALVLEIVLPKYLLSSVRALEMSAYMCEMIPCVSLCLIVCGMIAFRAFKAWRREFGKLTRLQSGRPKNILWKSQKEPVENDDKYILLDVLLCSIAEYFYELCRILASP